MQNLCDDGRAWVYIPQIEAFVRIFQTVPVCRVVSRVLREDPRAYAVWLWEGMYIVTAFGKDEDDTSTVSWKGE